MTYLRAVPTVKLAKVARGIRVELEHRAEYAARFGISAPGQISLAAFWPPPLSPLLPVAIALAALAWWVLR
jgi:hypothetical protein